MPLKSLTINGFKSFADKTKIDFTSGITGIVGPNGSGKSNITEAIRWVMGEQSAKSLRGDKMVDVIFAGSATRPQMNRAEVVLEFDNRNHELKSSQDEIVICRRLFRNGDTEFLINNKQCRLRDITELFMDSGMGKQSFSIISQGRVEAIFNSKPVERRTIIEESAGVSLFKQKKQQAENKMSETTDNLHRVSDIVSELSKQVEPLKEQASIARDYQEQKSKYDSIYQKILTIEIRNLSAQKHQIDKELREVKLSAQNIAREVKIANKQVEDNNAAINDLTQKIDENQTKLVENTRTLEVYNGKVAVADERSGFNSTNQLSLNKQLDDLKKQREVNEKKLTDSNQKLADCEAQIADFQKQLKDVQQLKQKTPADIEKNISDLRDQYVDLLQEQVSNNNEQNFSQKQLDRIQAQIGDQNQQIESINSDLTESKEKRQAVEARVKTLVTDNKSLIEHDRTLAKEIDQVTETGKQENRNYLNVLEGLQEIKARKKVLENMEQEHAGFFEGAKNILNNQSKLTGIVGAIAELISVPKEYQLAVETVVSNQLQSIVTEDEVSAKKAIAFLRQSRGGRATFLPLNIIKPRSIYANDLNKAQAIAGFVGVASDLIKYDGKVENIVKNILGNLLVSENIDAATRISAAVGRKYRVVTLDGNVVNAGGSLTGGQQRRVNSNILTRKDDLTALTTELSKKEILLDQKQKTVQDLRQKLIGLNAEKKTADEKLASFNQEKNQLENSMSTYRNEEKHFKERLDVVQYSLSKNQAEESDLKSDLEKQVQLANDIKDKIARVQDEIKQKEQILADFDSELNSINENEQNLQTKLAVVQSKHENELAQNNDLKESTVSLSRQVTEVEERLKDLNSEKDKLQLSNSEVKEKINQLKQTIAELQNNATDLKSKRQKQQELSTQLNAKAQRNFDLQKNASDQQETLAIKNTKLSNEIDSRLDILSQDYQLTYEASLVELNKGDYDPEQLQKEARLLKMGIDELGTVNLSAIAEYDKVKDRYEFLTQQQNDLLKARAQLLDTMSEMDKEVTTRFKKTFDEVAAAFEDIFPEMFAGGRAKLVLTEPDNLLETGIEIIAQPPGKKFQRLSLLSGGEKALTAITLLFAIIKVKPVPFCILDEVEASLDDANVYRFANYLNQYDDNTEFIVITHRKGTMMNVNRLYGVTMEESGVSRMLSVEVKK
ncbi:chromosome segregation protein SMC [Companilactobacillus kimchii]|uniref:Chromosome partition protein Smc n=3 Tax=Companilactobacillus kimchii TaxID=2801452 RepID=A0ABR5NQB9_9LACO|nr:chromosome segregation protein SMC [Companilactobacillus kimchii]KAE9562823.1 chromosome segregation protein SMC [Companilactobacillus kimchii]KRK49855.1 chromosome seggregation Smc protein [Companilactobacillus kimchii DSM 13961 = JCM 10707]OWF33178.1 Chromosome partition protein Smc [Companilactobacillus kimchii]GEO46737.1 chromosome partition protein Smc [Companilactobacillus paralimentarius]